MRALTPVLLLYLALFSQSTRTDETNLVDQLQSRIQFHSSMQGDFQQEKHLHFMEVPFISSGSFTITEDSGLWWHVASPAESTMSVMDSRVSLDGKLIDDRGIGQMIALLMQGFMNGDLSALSDNFKVEGRKNEEAVWQLTLTPRGIMLGRVLQHIIASGGQHLEQVDIIETSGTRTAILFSNVREIHPQQGAASAGQ